MTKTELQIQSEIDFAFTKLLRSRTVRRSDNFFAVKHKRRVEVRMNEEGQSLVAHWFRVKGRILRKLYIGKSGIGEGSLDLGWYADSESIFREMVSHLGRARATAIFSCLVG